MLVEKSVSVCRNFFFLFVSNYGGLELQLFCTNYNYFLQTTTFSTNFNIFLEILAIFYHLATFFYSLYLFSTNHNFSIIHNSFLQPCLTKIRSARGGSHHLALMSNFSTQSQMSYPYLFSECFVIPVHYLWCVWEVGREAWAWNAVAMRDRP